MATINISLPVKLKKQAQELVDRGFYASFSDLVRDALRQSVKKSRYDVMVEKAIDEAKQGKGVWIRNKRDLDEYFKSI